MIKVEKAPFKINEIKEKVICDMRVSEGVCGL